MRREMVWNTRLQDSAGVLFVLMTVWNLMQVDGEWRKFVWYVKTGYTVSKLEWVLYQRISILLKDNRFRKHKIHLQP